ncbi:unnamed protein product, partial [Urochloa humidicola]
MKVLWTMKGLQAQKQQSNISNFSLRTMQKEVVQIWASKKGNFRKFTYARG